MNPSVIVYEMDSFNRDRMKQWLEESGIAYILCYSPEKFNIEIQKNSKKLNLIAAPFDVEHELNKNKNSNDILFYDRARLEKVEFISRIREMQKQMSRRKKSLGQQIFDILVIGSSTGGFPIVQQILDNLKINQSIVVIAQHVNKDMNEQLLKSLQTRALSSVVLVSEQMECQKGKIYLLGGGQDFEMNEKYGKLYLTPNSDLNSPYHPSINLFSSSLIRLSGYNRGLMILSGLGNDGSSLISDLNAQGVTIIVQDPTTSVAPGMPQSALSTGLVNQSLHPAGLAELLRKAVA